MQHAYRTVVLNPQKLVHRIVQPGVTIKFAPEVGFTVRGVFNADGGSNPKDKIR